MLTMSGTRMMSILSKGHLKWGCMSPHQEKVISIFRYHIQCFWEVHVFYGLCSLWRFHPEFACDASSDPGLDPDHCACVMCTGCPKSRCRLVAIAAPNGVDLFQCDTTPCLEVHRSLPQTTQLSKHSDDVPSKDSLPVAWCLIIIGWTAPAAFVIISLIKTITDLQNCELRHACTFCL